MSYRILEGQSGVALFRGSLDWPSDDLASVSSGLATEVGNALREQIGVEVRLREGRAAAPNSAAWLQVARAERSIADAAEALREGDGEAVSDAFDAAEPRPPLELRVQRARGRCRS